MTTFGIGYPWNVPLFCGFLFLLNFAPWLVCEWLERRRRSR